MSGDRFSRLGNISREDRAMPIPASVRQVMFGTIPVLCFLLSSLFCLIMVRKPVMLKKTHNILLFSLAIIDLLTVWYLVFEMSLKIFYAVNSFLKVPRLIDIILTSWPEIAKQ